MEKILYVEGQWWTNFNQLPYMMKKGDLLPRDVIKEITNLEALRIAKEKMGNDNYIKIMDLVLISKDVDSLGNEMVLYKYNEIDTEVHVLKVICPSTKREYYIYPPNQTTNDVFEAKESTFSKKIKYRHGDVGLHKRNVGDNENNYEIET